MSTDVSDGITEKVNKGNDCSNDETAEEKEIIIHRKVSFPDEQHLVTQYFEAADPWHDVCAITPEQLAREYEESCLAHSTQPIESVLQQIQELPESATDGSGSRAPRLCLAACSLRGAAAADALEALFRRTRYHRLELHHAALDDEGAEALFDMIEYYESTTALSITGPQEFGIRGWQACSRMIKKSAALTELEVREAPIEDNHAPVLARALKPLTCRLRVLKLQRVSLAGQPLLCLVTALKSNNSVRELQLADNALSATDAAQLAALLRANTRIQLLDLSNNQIQDAGANHIANALVEQAARTPPSAATSPLSPHHCSGTGSYEGRGLAVLVLWNNQLTRIGANHLGRALRSSSSLCVLNVGRNALGAKAVRALRSLGALACLGLQAARLGADAARPLAEMIRARTQLQRLDLRDNRLGGAGLQAILAAMRDNTTLTQIDLDDDTEWSSSLHAEPDAVESAERVRLAREIRALCRRNEPAEPRPHRKISLTCHSACLARTIQSLEEERRREKLRSPSPSPAPSPAGSPVPQHSRFSVTLVNDRESALTGAARPSPSRFRVVQVSEPPSIQVTSIAASPKSVKSSRFSVTRNYDTAYNTKSVVDKTIEPNNDIISANLRSSNHSTDESEDARDEKQSLNENKYEDKTQEVTHKEELTFKGDDKIVSSETKLVKNSTEASDVEKTDIQIEVILKKERITDDGNSSCNVVNSVNNDFAKVHPDQNDECDENADSSVVEIFKTIDDINLEHNKELTARDSEALKQIEALTEDLGNLIQEMKDRSKTALVRKLSDAETENKEIDTDVKSDSTQTDALDSESIALKMDPPKSRDDISVPVSVVNEHNLALKKNKSESSLDSPDLEVSRLMDRKETTAFCDSSSSLEISGSSIESLNASDMQHNNISRIIIPQPEVQIIARDNIELDRRKSDLSTESSLDSNTSEITPVNTENFLNTSISSNESVSPILFGKRKLHGSISSLEASVSSLDSGKGENKEKIMVTSADSGIEYSIHQTIDANPETRSSNGTLTNNFSLKEIPQISPEKRKISGELFQNVQDTLTLSPKRTSSLLDVPALKNKGLERMRKISWVAPSSSFHIPKPEPEPPKVESKLSSNLEKLLSLFHHPSSIFSRSQSDDEKKSTTPPRKDSSSLASSFWVWTSGYTDKVEKDPSISSHDRDSSPENATDSSTLSERVQVSFVDESFSKKLESKTPSTDTDNTLSEFQSLPTQNVSETSDEYRQDATEEIVVDRTIEVKEEESKEVTTDGCVSTDNIVQSLDLSSKGTANGNEPAAKCDILIQDLIQNPNDLNRNYETEGSSSGDDNQNRIRRDSHDKIEYIDNKNSKEALIFEESKPATEVVRPRSFAAVLKSTSGNSLDRQTSPESGQPIDKLPTKIIRGIKENISPENTLTSSATNIQALAEELAEKQIKTSPGCNEHIVNALWDVSIHMLENLDVTSEVKNDEKVVISGENVKRLESQDSQLNDDSLSIGIRTDISAVSDKNMSTDNGVTSLKITEEKSKDYINNLDNNKEIKGTESVHVVGEYPENVDMGKDALAFLLYENQEFELDRVGLTKKPDSMKVGIVLAQELRDAEAKEQLLDLSPELVIDDAEEVPEIFTGKEVIAVKPPVIPERAKLKKSNSLEELSRRLHGIDLDVTEQSRSAETKSPKNIAFALPELTCSIPKDIPEPRGSNLRSRSSSSPKSLPESLIKPSPLSKMEAPKKKKKVCSLGKMARDSLLALNMSEDEIAEFRRPYKLTSVESLRSLESVSEDANSQSGNSIDSRCRTCLRTSQESLMSLDSISEDCRCMSDSCKAATSHSAR